MSKANEPAFPVAASYSDDNPRVLVPQGGMSLHTYLVGQAMMGLLANPALTEAEALILELDKTEK